MEVYPRKNMHVRVPRHNELQLSIVNKIYDLVSKINENVPFMLAYGRPCVGCGGPNFRKSHRAVFCSSKCRNKIRTSEAREKAFQTVKIAENRIKELEQKIAELEEGLINGRS